MAWTPPNTAIAGTVWTAADWNTYVRDNLLETEIGKTVSNGAYNWAVVGDNDITEVGPAQALVAFPTVVSTSSATYVTLGGSTPSVTLDTGYVALVCVYAWTRNNVDSGTAWFGVRVSGATSGDFNVLAQGTPAANQLRCGSAMRIFTLNPGSNTFTGIYASTNGGGTSEFSNRTIAVIPM